MFYSRAHGFLAFRSGSVIYFLKFGETEENAVNEYQKGIVFVSPEKKKNRNTSSPLKSPQPRFQRKRSRLPSVINPRSIRKKQSVITQKAAFDNMKNKDAIIISRNQGKVIDIDRERKLKHLQKFKKGCSLLYPITHIAAASDLSVIYIARESQLEVWERTGNDSFVFVKNLGGHSKPITSIYYNEDRQMLVSSDTSSKILFWKGNKTNAKLVITQSTRPNQVVPSCMVLFSGRRRLFVGTKEGKLLKYDQKEGRNQDENFLETGKYSGQVGITALATTSAEDLLVAGTQGGFIFVWRTLEDGFGEYDLQVGSPSTQITDVRIEPSGRFIISGSIDSSIKVFKRDQCG